jgi:hypothetical protein
VLLGTLRNGVEFAGVAGWLLFSCREVTRIGAVRRHIFLTACYVPVGVTVLEDDAGLCPPSVVTLHVKRNAMLMSDWVTMNVARPLLELMLSRVAGCGDAVKSKRAFDSSPLVTRHVSVTCSSSCGVGFETDKDTVGGVVGLSGSGLGSGLSGFDGSPLSAGVFGVPMGMMMPSSTHPGVTAIASSTEKMASDRVSLGAICAFLRWIIKISFVRMLAGTSVSAYLVGVAMGVTSIGMVTSQGVWRRIGS